MILNKVDKEKLLPDSNNLKINIQRKSIHKRRFLAVFFVCFAMSL